MSRMIVCASLLASLLAAGCATPDQRVAALTRDNETLRKTVADRESDIKSLTDKNAFLTQESDYFRNRSTVLDSEKGLRIDEIRQLRLGVSEFTEEVIKSLESAYRKRVPVDLVGSEICERRLLGQEKKEGLLVDVAHPIRSNGTVVGGRAWVVTPCVVRFCIIRAAEGKTTVRWMSEELTAAAAGAQSWTFKAPYPVKSGDLFALYTAQGAPVPYDDADTGHVAVLEGGFGLNDTVKLTPAAQRRNRAYSFGIVGYFDETAGNGAR